MPDQMRRETEDVIRYYGELSRRIASRGVDGIPGLLELSDSLECALAEISMQELAWMTAEIKCLLDQLVAMDAQLQRLRELKVLLAGGSERVPQLAERA